MENTETKYVVCLSGGKDSVYLLFWLLNNGYRVDGAVYAHVMATDTLSGDFPEMEKYLDKIEQRTGIRITRISKRVSFEDIFYRVKMSGKQEGNIYGFPYTIGAWCQSRLKANLLNEYFKAIGPNHVRYVGITAGEDVRYARLANTTCKAPLYENGITGEDCRRELSSMDMLNPLYEKFRRLGCWFCPKQSMDSLRVLYRDYPLHWEQLLKWDNDSPVSFKPGWTVKELDERFYFETLREKEEVAC